ncbi:hypothetical protein BS50DRAFT_656378 [Corynespora cassiicola Philippines]|uniref:Uncharacterized protein n=1 Tax=Corynespora cassiicola Philippines TaxID=1448308 RepID=A0A2T2N3Y5_CORCC|nr:hypothetical protein BS50DRAFT_656378 [Corynespora cassiicola Philippines]
MSSNESKPATVSRELIQPKDHQEEPIRQTARSKSSSRRSRRQRSRRDTQSGKVSSSPSTESLAICASQNKAESLERKHSDTSLERYSTKSMALESHPEENETYTQQNAEKKRNGLQVAIRTNLQVEIELKASIRGDLTVSL